MKKMNRVVSAVMAASVAALALAGCGSSSSGSTDSSAAATTTAAAEGTSSAAAADSGATFKIGVIGPLTGGAAQYGNGVANAAQIAVDEINAAGGMNGYQVELQSEDDALDNQQSVDRKSVV